MVGARLEVDLHIATCSGSALQSTVTCANRAGLEVTEAVLESIAAAEATLSADERELGVCLLDIGAHSSDLVVFFEGAVAHTASVPIGGAALYQRPGGRPADARGSGRRTEAPVRPCRGDGRAAGGGDRDRQSRSRRCCACAPLPRFWSRAPASFLYFVKESLRQGGVVDALGAGCVLTGGGAMLPGMLDVTESQLRVPARTGMPVRLSNMPGELVHPSFCHRHWNALVCSPHARDARGREQQSARQAARHFCSQFLEVELIKMNQEDGSRRWNSRRTKPERCAFNITKRPCAEPASRSSAWAAAAAMPSTA